MTIHDIINAGLAVFATLITYLIESRRIGADATRIRQLEAHAANLETRLLAIENRHDRIDRAR